MFNLLVIKVYQGLISLLTLLLHSVDSPGNGPDTIVSVAMISETMGFGDIYILQVSNNNIMTNT